MKRTATVKCHFPGCDKTAYFEYDSVKESVEGRPTRDNYLCVRHSKTEEVLSRTSPIKETVLISVKDNYTDKRYWNHMGFVYGPGFKAFCDDFPEGTKLIITARVEIP